MTQIENGKLKIENSKRDKKIPQQGTAEYYKELSDRIKLAHEQERRMAMRYVAYVEEQLKLALSLRVWRCNQGSGLRVQDSSNHEPCTMNHESESIATLERGLYKHQDCAEREGGDLLKRWQKCLAECILKQMTAADNSGLNTD